MTHTVCDLRLWRFPRAHHLQPQASPPAKGRTLEVRVSGFEPILSARPVVIRVEPWSARTEPCWALEPHARVASTLPERA